MPANPVVRVRFAVCTLLLLALVMLPLSGWTQGQVWPEASGDVTYKDSGTVVDASHTVDGYIMAKCKESKKVLKTRVSQGDTTLTYDQNLKGNYEVYSLQMGTGKYKVAVFEQVKGTKYAPKGSVSFKVNEMDEYAPYLCPNQYVWYTKDSPVVAKSNELCTGLTTDKDKINAIYKHVTTTMVYNYPRALTVKTGYVPDIDAVYKEGSGICFDISALIACMLRVQGIPTKMIIGHADKNYHAWNMILHDGKYRLVDATAAIAGGGSKDTKYNPEREY